MDQTQPISRPIDPHAARIPTRSGLLPCLFIPIATRDLPAIETYVGSICRQLAPNTPNMAVLVRAHEPDRPDARLPIWELPEAAILQAPSQVWVHVDFRAYRRAYIEAFRGFSPAGFVLDHILNRRVARLKRFQYLRIVPISRAANSSHGALSEDWGVKYHSSPEMRAKNDASLALVQYADIADIVKMLDRKSVS
jgi:hypothetical protein